MGNVVRLLVAAPVVLVGALFVLYLAWAAYTQVTVGCVEPPFSLDGCRDPYAVWNRTDDPVTIYHVEADGSERKLLGLGPAWMPLNISPASKDRCQDGFNLVARDQAGTEVARRDHWCRYDEWVIDPVVKPSSG